MSWADDVGQPMIQYAPEITSEERGRLKRAKKEAREQKEEEEKKLSAKG